MYSQVKVIGWIYTVIGALKSISGLCTAGIIFAGGLFSGEETAVLTTGIIALLMVGLAFIFAIPGFITGIGLLKLKRWARILAVVLAVLCLPVFPLGTAFGIYVLYVMFDNETRMIFYNPTIDN